SSGRRRSSASGARRSRTEAPGRSRTSSAGCTVTRTAWSVGVMAPASPRARGRRRRPGKSCARPRLPQGSRRARYGSPPGGVPLPRVHETYDLGMTRSGTDQADARCAVTSPLRRFSGAGGTGAHPEDAGPLPARGRGRTPAAAPGPGRPGRPAASGQQSQQSQTAERTEANLVDTNVYAPAGPPAPARDGAGRAVRARSLSKTYGRGEAVVRALDGVDVDCEQGRFTAIMGPSGSGKSTLMHLLAGLDSASGGQVFLGETEITGLGDKALTRLRRDR